jgi:NAD-dependent deacetylase
VNASADLAALRAALAGARRPVVFTGAGVSTASGIPDFRSPGGLWTRYRPIEFQDFLASEEARRETWRRKFALDAEIGAAQPNAGHYAITRLVRRTPHGCVIPQNIDGLHGAAGVEAERLVELHGNGTYAACLDCGAREALGAVRARFEPGGPAPRCGACGGFVKPATISFGQPMPEEPMRRAQRAALHCDVFLVAGSSLQVYPAAGFPELAKRAGARLAIVNREPTPLDGIADVVVHGEIVPVLDGAVGQA